MCRYGRSEARATRPITTGRSDPERANLTRARYKPHNPGISECFGQGAWDNRDGPAGEDRE